MENNEVRGKKNRTTMEQSQKKVIKRRRWKGEKQWGEKKKREKEKYHDNIEEMENCVPIGSKYLETNFTEDMVNEIGSICGYPMLL